MQQLNKTPAPNLDKTNASWGIKEEDILNCNFLWFFLIRGEEYYSLQCIPKTLLKNSGSQVTPSEFKWINIFPTDFSNGDFGISLILMENCTFWFKDFYKMTNFKTKKGQKNLYSITFLKTSHFLQLNRSIVCSANCVERLCQVEKKLKNYLKSSPAVFPFSCIILKHAQYIDSLDFTALFSLFSNEHSFFQ